MKVKKYIEKFPKKIMNASELMEKIIVPYDLLVEEVNQLVSEGVLAPVKSSGTNGRRPVLYNRYRIIKSEKDYSDVYGKIRLLHGKFDHQYYLDHPESYLDQEEDIRALSNFLWHRAKELETPMSINERSFSIFGKEKLLKSVEKKFGSCFHLRDFIWEDLNIYATPEPFFEYIHPNIPEGDILVVENKDTWYTLRKIMRDEDKVHLFGIDFRVLLYGEGKKITRQSGRLREYSEEVLGDKDHRFYYFGDLDYEGISIFQEAKQKNPEIRMELLTPAYELMLTLSENMRYPMTRDHRMPRADVTAFLALFSEDHQKKILDILESGCYIPQEILSYTTLRSLMKGNSYV